MSVQLLLRVIRQKFTKLASGAARLFIKPSSRPICSQPAAATTEAVSTPPPHDNNTISVSTVDPVVALSNHHVHENKVTNVSSDVKEKNISTAARSSSPKCSGWDIIKTASYDRHWKAIEDEILQDIDPLVHLARKILHSRGYKNGDRLTKKDEKNVMDNLVKYHHGFEKKIGSGFSYIMVNRHVEFADTRCMYVVRTDGSRIDFSYKKCLRGYIELKYPSHAEKFAQWNPRLVK